MLTAWLDREGPALPQDAQGPSGTARHPNLHPCPLCPQVLLGHPPPYAMDITAQVHTVPTPAAVLSPPLPEIVPPAAPELLPQLPSSLAPVMVAAAQSLPVQTTALLPPSNLPLPSGPGLSSSCPAVQLTVELAPEVCALPMGLGIQCVTPMPGPSIAAAPLAVPLGLSPRIRVALGKVEACAPGQLWVPFFLALPPCHTFLQCTSRWKGGDFYTEV